MAFVFVRFPSTTDGKSYEPAKWRRIIHDNLFWSELDDPVHCWRARISHCWVSKEFPCSLNLEVCLGLNPSLQKLTEELRLLAGIFLGAVEVNLFYPPLNMEIGPEVSSFTKALVEVDNLLQFRPRTAA